jgi:hypothetical protein
MGVARVLREGWSRRGQSGKTHERATIDRVFHDEASVFEALPIRRTNLWSAMHPALRDKTSIRPWMPSNRNNNDALRVSRTASRRSLRERLNNLSRMKFSMWPPVCYARFALRSSIAPLPAIDPRFRRSRAASPLQGTAAQIDNLKLP